MANEGGDGQGELEESRSRSRGEQREERDRVRQQVAEPLDEIEETFGGQDPFIYGIEPNRNILNAMIGYSVEQGLATRKVEIEELFAEECFGSLEAVPHPGFSAN